MSTPTPSPAAEDWSVTSEIDRLCEDETEVPAGFFFPRRIPAARRAEVLHNVFLDSAPRWRSSFIVMLLLSGGIATLGLSQDSAATVIGSMIIAPLGAPIVGLGAGVALFWPRESIRMLATVAAGAASVVVIAFLFGLVLPNETPTAQILARTNPDLRDLGVAVLAGAAGAYSYTRASLSSALVGVAIAVALVPPLATVGLMLEEGHWTLAQGAITLFMANFAGITVAAAAVLLVTGFVPRPRLRGRSLGVVGGLVATATLVGAVAVPLTATYRSLMNSTQTRTDVYRQVTATVGAGNTATVVHKIDISGNVVTIDLSDPDAAPSASTFEADLIDEVGPDVRVVLE